MNYLPVEKKLVGINAWLVIEILSFYGYILSAAFFIIERQIKSSMGLLDKRNTKLRDAYQGDFVSFHKKDLDWLAFVYILFSVNGMLLLIDENVIFTQENPLYSENDLAKAQFPLRHVSYILLFNHFLQFIFIRDFYDVSRRVNEKHRWVWYVHGVCYLYVICIYFFSSLV